MMGIRMMLRFVALVALSLGLSGCAVTAVVGAAASVVGAGVDVAGSAVSATIDVVGSGVSGAIDLATSDDDEEDGNKDKKVAPEDKAAKQIIAGAKPESLPKDADSETSPTPEGEDGHVETVMELGD
jgi:hypothetical protein